MHYTHVHKTPLWSISVRFVQKPVRAYVLSVYSVMVVRYRLVVRASDLTTWQLWVQIPASEMSDNNLRQVVHTHVPLLITNQYKLVLAKRRWRPTAGKVTVGLASRWPCVTDFYDLSTYGLKGLWKGDDPPRQPTPLNGTADLYLLPCVWLARMRRSVAVERTRVGCVLKRSSNAQTGDFAKPSKKTWLKAPLHISQRTARGRIGGQQHPHTHTHTHTYIHFCFKRLLKT